MGWLVNDRNFFLIVVESGKLKIKAPTNSHLMRALLSSSKMATSVSSPGGRGQADL
jgi:hypothetical protein